MFNNLCLVCISWIQLILEILLFVIIFNILYTEFVSVFRGGSHFGDKIDTEGFIFCNISIIVQYR